VSEVSANTGNDADANSFAVQVWEWFERFVSSFWEGLGWPHAVLIIFLVVMLCYRKELRELIERIREFGPGGFKLQPISFQNPQSETADLPASESSAATAVVTSVPATGVLGAPIPLPPTIVFPTMKKDCEDGIAREIQGMTDADAKSYLVPMLAISRAMWVFESCYANIYGGQIRLLLILNQRPGKAVSNVEVVNYWTSHQEQMKPYLNLWTADQYLNYLVQNGLVTKLVDSIALTTKGVEFVLWLTQYGRSLDRGL
jgi:hypothetical protein